VHGVFVRADSALRSVRDLRGQRIAVNTVKAIDEVMLSALIQREGGDAAGNRFVPINFPAMQPALLAGEVDAVVVIEPFVALAQAEPALRRISTLYAELQPVTEISAFVARSGLDLAMRSPAARLRSALQAAARHANRYPEQVRELLPEFVDVERSALQRAVLPHFMERQLDSARLDETIRIMQSAGWIGPKLRAARLLDAATGPTSVLHPRWQTRNASRQA
jgi:NitT/TauT family transport system substrate-binding protein